MSRAADGPAASAVPAAAPIDLAIERVRRVYGGWRRDTPIARKRADWEALFARGVQPLEARTAALGGIDCLWVGSGAQVLLYFHGGGYQLGSVRSHLDLMQRIAAAAHCRVLGVNYRLAPEHHFPAPIEDAVEVYENLLKTGVAAAHIAFAGDSAGAGLAAAAVLALRARGAALPAALVMLSAWTDLTGSGNSYASRAAADPIHQRAMILNTAREYLGPDGDACDPLASPLFGELSGFPPLLLQVGDRETVLNDSTRFAERARAAGVPVELEVYAGMIHVFQQFADLLPEARAAIESIGHLLQHVWRSAR